MKKKNSSGKTGDSEECVSTDSARKPLVCTKKGGGGGNEIDEIFSSKKRRKPDMKKNDITVQGEVSGKPKLLTHEKKKKKKIDDSESPAGKQPRRKTLDGLTIYKEEELGISKENAGSTRLCPFDCDCCF